MICCYLGQSHRRESVGANVAITRFSPSLCGSTRPYLAQIGLSKSAPVFVAVIRHVQGCQVLNSLSFSFLARSVMMSCLGSTTGRKRSRQVARLVLFPIFSSFSCLPPHIPIGNDCINFRKSAADFICWTLPRSSALCWL